MIATSKPALFPPPLTVWEAIDKVASKHPDQDKWTWADWLCVIDLADIPCHHPVRFRETVAQGEIFRGPDKGKIFQFPTGERCLDDYVICGTSLSSKWAQKAIEAEREGAPLITYCPVCSMYCPAPPVDMREQRAQQLLALLLAAKE